MNNIITRIVHRRLRIYTDGICFILRAPKHHSSKEQKRQQAAQRRESASAPATANLTQRVAVILIPGPGPAVKAKAKKRSRWQGPRPPQFPSSAVHSMAIDGALVYDSVAPEGSALSRAQGPSPAAAVPASLGAGRWIAARAVAERPAENSCPPNRPSDRVPHGPQCRRRFVRASGPAGYVFRDMDSDKGSRAIVSVAGSGDSPAAQRGPNSNPPPDSPSGVRIAPDFVACLRRKLKVVCVLCLSSSLMNDRAGGNNLRFKGGARRRSFLSLRSLGPSPPACVVHLRSFCFARRRLCVVVVLAPLSQGCSLSVGPGVSLQ